ncbi:MAG TPA: metallophosphoesterase [Anaerolineales bacterium]|nr:metallophosphoesterase [Anaerolineales bacterium]
MRIRISKFYALTTLIILAAAGLISGCTQDAGLVAGSASPPPTGTQAENCATPDAGEGTESSAPEICNIPGLTPLPTGGEQPLPPGPEPAATAAGTATTAVPEVPTPTSTSVQPTATHTPEIPQFEPVVFAVIGDYGRAGDPAADVAALVKSRAPDLVLTTGDNNYPAGDWATIDANVGQYYHEFIYPYQGSYGEGAAENRFFPTLGNHDWDTAAAGPYLDYFTLPGNERYYDFVWGPVHFFAIDSDSREPDGVSSNSIQADWLREGLAAAEEPWKVVYMHHPAYSSAVHGSIVWMQWPFAEWGADAVLAGHDHVYERLEVDGLTYIISGLGGFGPYNFNTPLPGSLVRFNDDYGALFVEATQDAITFQFVTRAGEVVDTFSLTGG